VIVTRSRRFAFTDVAAAGAPGWTDAAASALADR